MEVDTAGRQVAREYIQARILASLQRQGAMAPPLDPSAGPALVSRNTVLEALARP